MTSMTSSGLSFLLTEDVILLFSQTEQHSTVTSKITPPCKVGGDLLIDLLYVVKLLVDDEFLSNFISCFFNIMVHMSSYGSQAT